MRVKLYKGSAVSVATRSPYSLYSEEFATFSRHQIGYVQRVDIFNDHLNQRLRGVPGSKTAMSDHGQIAVQLNFFEKEAPAAAASN